MKLIIAGGRDYIFNEHDVKKLNAIPGITEVVSGGATGADACGEKWAAYRKLPVKRFPAEWDKHGRAAGPLRNKQMAEYADAVALFPGGRGTQNMHMNALRFKLRVFDFRI
ncbi:DUF2493 domain-containing protein [Azospirillaceae bacterium]